MLNDTSPSQPVLRAVDAYKVLGQEVKVSALLGVNLSIEQGEFACITGPSGSGKSTLLYLLGGLDLPSGGEIWIGPDCTKNLGTRDLARLRRERIGFVFQFHFLLPEFSAMENVMIPQLALGRSPKEAEKRATQLLAQVGLTPRLSHRPHQLSGGEQQRVAIARSLANDPLVLLADEPTGNLDTHNGDQVFDLLHQLNQEAGHTIVVVTHDQNLANQGKRLIQLVDGQVV